MSTSRVLLLGWDGADWKLIHPLLDAGEMPHLQGLIERGVMGNLMTLQPILSPMLWTSIATGKRADKHGIFGFVEPQPDGKGVRPVSSTSRRGKALWNIASQAELSSVAVGWYASHPAEPIRGVSVSDHYHKMGRPSGPADPWPVAPGSIHPAELADALADLRAHPLELEGTDLGPFLEHPERLDPAWPATRQQLEMLRRVLSETVSVHNVSSWLLEHTAWELAALYYDAIDHFCHGFMPFHPPMMPGIPDELRPFSGVVRAAYRFHDLMLGRLLAFAGEDTTVILVSDHGFHGDHLRPRGTPRFHAGPAIWHRPQGILVMAGPGIRADERIHGASLLDIAPTILTRLGLPVGADMDGKVLVQAFETPPAVARIPSWEAVDGPSGQHPADRQEDPYAAVEALAQLVELGYIEAPDGDAERAVEIARTEATHNRAQALLGMGQADEAARLYRALVDDRPDAMRFKAGLGQSLLEAGRTDEARVALERLAREHPRSGRTHLLMGLLLTETGELDRALDHLRVARSAEPRLPDLHVALGRVYLARGAWGDARSAFATALEIDPDSHLAHHGLAIVALRQRRARAAADHALTAIGLEYHAPAAHYHLGLALLRLGWRERAAEALEAGVAQRPGLRRARRVLVRLYDRVGDSAGAARHRAALAELAPR